MEEKGGDEPTTLCLLLRFDDRRRRRRRPRLLVREPAPTSILPSPKLFVGALPVRSNANNPRTRCTGSYQFLQERAELTGVEGQTVQKSNIEIA